MKNKNIISTFVLITLSQFVNAQDQVQIGTQIWSTKNMDVTIFRNSNPIPEAKSKAEWKKAAINKESAWCYYNYDPANENKYGRLYNWYAVNDPAGLAPNGWHIPSDDEFAILARYLEPGEGAKIRSTKDWSKDQNGSNSSGFNGFPVSKCTAEGSFYSDDIGWSANWWTSTEIKDWQDNVWYRHTRPIERPELDTIERTLASKGTGFSIRCVKD